MAVTIDAGFPVSVRDTSSSDPTWPTFTTPGTNRMVVAMFLGNGAGATEITSFTSPNLTWTNRVAVVDGANNWRVEIWTAWASSVVTTEQINTTCNPTSLNYSRMSVLVWSLNGSDSAGVGNTGTTTTSNDADVSITATAAGSLLLAGLPYRSAGGDIGVDANSTSQYDAGGGTGFGFNERACSRASSGAGALTLGFTTAELFTSAAMGGIEIKAAPGGTGYATLPNLIEAWDPANAVLSGSDVTSLPGTHNSRTLTTPATDPTIVTAGLPSGANSILVNSGGAKYFQLLEANMVTGTTFTIMSMLKLVGSINATNQRILSFAPSGGADWSSVSGAVFHPNATGPVWPFAYRNANLADGGDVTDADVWHLFMGIFDGSNLTYYIAHSGATGWTTVNNPASTGTFDIDEFRIGAAPGGTDTGQVLEIGDVVWYSDAKDSTARQALFDIAYPRAFTSSAPPASPVIFTPRPILFRR